MQSFTADELIAIINANDTAAANALLGLYARQTADEQEAQANGHKNGQGFNGTDAAILSSFAEQVLAWKATPESLRRHRSPLSPKQLEMLRKKIAKYSRQLVEIAEEKAAARAERAVAA